MRKDRHGSNQRDARKAPVDQRDAADHEHLPGRVEPREQRAVGRAPAQFAERRQIVGFRVGGGGRPQQLAAERVLDPEPRTQQDPRPHGVEAGLRGHGRARQQRQERDGLEAPRRDRAVDGVQHEQWHGELQQGREASQQEGRSKGTAHLAQKEFARPHGSTQHTKGHAQGRPARLERLWQEGLKEH